MTILTIPNLVEYSYHPSDLLAVLDLICNRAPEDRLEYPGFSDVRELLELFQTGEFIRLWKARNGHLAGYAILDAGETYVNLTFEIAQNVSASSLGEGMLAWAEQTYRKNYRGQAAGITLSVRANQSERLALLERSGYHRQSEETFHLVRSLLEPIPSPALSEGYTIRSLAGEAEAPAWVALHQAAFGTHNMTLEAKLAMLRQPGYDPELDLVAVAPDGSLAAYVLCSISREENALGGQETGTTDPVGTHPRHQRRGLCRALLLKGMTLLKDRGVTLARMGTSSENIPMRQAAHSAGYVVSSRLLRFQKDLQS